MEPAVTARMRIGIRADGGSVLGLGHLSRCLALAETLRSAHGIECRFYLHQDSTGEALIQERAWPVTVLPSDRPDVIPTGDDLLVIDLPGGVLSAYMEALRHADPHRLLAIFDGTCEGRLAADLVVAPLERLQDPAHWEGFRGRRYEGLDYAILSPDYADLPRRVVDETREPQLLVTMGGADPHDLTQLALEALDTMPDEFQTTVALGPAFTKAEEIWQWVLSARRKYETRRVGMLAPLMVASDLAVTSFGTTSYELAAAGLPSVELCITPDHVEAADIFARGGSMVSAGLFSSVSKDRLANMVHELLSDSHRRSKMATAGQALVDGKGARRVADLLVAAIAENSAS
jgi:spore coat polysaccharide biosynthesis predicted glycosyltransferase SpsG